MIAEDYCSYEVAKLLKEKGFDWPCHGTYDTAVTGGKPKFSEYEVLSFFPYGMKNTDDKYGMIISAPTHQMAMRWLRESHNLYIEPYVVKNYNNNKLEYTYSIQDLDFNGSDDGIDCCKNWNSPEEACEAALKYCLKHLI